jgi:cysteine-S-conjugate beta-lyase
VTITSPLNWLPAFPGGVRIGPFGLLCVAMHNGFEDLDLDRLRRRHSEKWRLYPPDVLPAFIAEMDYDLAEPMVAALRTALDLSDCGYASLGGLGETFAAFAATRHDWAVDPGRVHLVPDVMAGFDAILALATEPGDGVVINPPVYPPFFQHIGFDGRRVVEVPLIPEAGRWELDFAGLEAAFAAGARGYLLCNPHNPTGRVFSADDLGRIAALAEQYGVLVIADEIHASLTLPGARHTPFVSLGGAAAEHGVTLASASKAFNVAGLKGAVAVAGSAAGERLLARLPASCQYGAGLFGVLASLAAWSSGGDWLDALLAQLDHARTEFGTLLSERLPGALYTPPEASFLAWVDCAGLGLGPEPARVFLDRGRVALGRGLDFGAPGDGFVRVTIGTSTALLSGIVDRMAAAVALAVPAEAGGQVVVDDAAGLHGRVGGHRAGEGEAVPLELGAERLGGRRGRGQIGHRPRRRPGLGRVLPDQRVQAVG